MAVQNRRILIVDDTPAIHDDFRKVLAPPVSPAGGSDDLEAALFGASAPSNESVCFELSSAVQGLEAVELVRAAKEAGTPYAMAFVDVRMPPGMDGVETVVRLWAIDPRLEIVLCTAYADYTWQQLLQRLVRRDQFLVIGKPFESLTVRQAALAMVEKWRLAREEEEARRGLEAQVAERTRELSRTNLELRRQIDRREQLEQQLILGAKLKALGQLVAGIAHEVNNPLAFVLANLRYVVEELEAETREPERFAESLAAAREAREGAERIREIVRDLKAFSSGEGEALHPTDLGGAVSAALGLTRISLEHAGVRLELALEQLEPVRGSPGLLSQLLVNLLLNAEQALEGVPAGQRQISIRTRSGGADFALLEVQDNGCGIAPDHLPRVLDPFFTTRAIGEGTGLGLAVCHGILERLGGSIELTSQIGCGTTVLVRLPLFQPEPEQQAPSSPRAAAAAS